MVGVPFCASIVVIVVDSVEISIALLNVAIQVTVVVSVPASQSTVFQLHVISVVIVSLPSIDKLQPSEPRAGI
jgi:hypothetical protein